MVTSVLATSAAFIIPGLSPQEQAALNEAVHVWREKAERNKLRQAYYDAKVGLKTLGIAIPPSLESIDTVLGWPAKAVDGLARRCNHEGFVIPGADVADFGIPEIWDENNLHIETPQAIASAMTHSVSFATVTLGDVASGEPKVLVTFRDALSAAATWDARRRRIRTFLSVVESDPQGSVLELVLYPDAATIVQCRRETWGTPWTVRRFTHSLGRLPVEPLVYKPMLRRPFGQSRITRPVMALTDTALRTLVRSEVGAEFFNAPQRYVMGADEAAFQEADGTVKTQWSAIMGRVWAIAGDDEGNNPTVGQFPQVSMQPNLDQLRTIAQLMSGETNLSVSSYGIVQDNPSSAESIYAAKEELLIDAFGASDVFGVALSRISRDAVQIRDGLSTPPDELLKLRAVWADPSTPSRAAAADATAKTVGVFGDWMRDSPVALEMAGFDQPTIARLLADRERFEAKKPTEPPQPPPAVAPEADLEDDEPAA